MKKKLILFEWKLFAAVTQVQHATSLSGRSVIMQILYPDIAAGIQSDAENLVGVIEYISRRNVRWQYCRS